MGLLNNMLNSMGLRDDDDYYDDEYYDDEIDSYNDTKAARASKKSKEEPAEQNSKASKEASSKSSKKITPFTAGKGKGTGMEVCVIKPTLYADAREIVDTLLADHAVIINMEGLDVGIAQMIINFVSGACFAMNGNLQKVSNYIFLATPPTVDISGDIQGLVDSLDFGGLQTGF